MLIRRTPHGLNVNWYTRSIKLDNPAQNLSYDPSSSPIRAILQFSFFFFFFSIRNFTSSYDIRPVFLIIPKRLSRSWFTKLVSEKSERRKKSYFQGKPANVGSRDEEISHSKLTKPCGTICFDTLRRLCSYHVVTPRRSNEFSRNEPTVAFHLKKLVFLNGY